MSTQPAVRSRPAVHPDTARQPPIAAGRWSVVPAISTAVFSVRELGVRRVRGSFPVLDGVVEVDGAGRPVSVRAALNARGIATGSPKRDADLRGPRFLGADRWPAITFASREVHGNGPDWTGVGTLTVRDVRSPLTLLVRLAGTHSDGSQPPATGPGGNRRAVVTASLDRRLAGVGFAPALLIARTVRIALDVTLAPPRP